MVTILEPIWLLLAVPLALSLRIWRLPSRLLFILRALALGLVLLAMADLAIRFPSRDGTVVVVADRSLSMPAGSESLQAEAVRLIAAEKAPDDRLLVVSFGHETHVEQFGPGDEFGGFTGAVDQDASNYSMALEQSLALIPRETPGSVLVLGDGRWTGKDPTAVAARAVARGIAIDHRLMERLTIDDVAVTRVDRPHTVHPGEAYMINAWVRSPLAQEITYELRRDTAVLARGKTSIGAGTNRLSFRDRASESGVHRYQLSVLAAGEDPVPENNAALFFVGIEGQRPILHLTENADSAFAKLLAAGKIRLATMTPAEARWSLEDLAGYSAVITENVPASAIGAAAMENLAAWVKETGSGLMFTGGRSSYGPGGYYKSPLEPVLPVSMELRQEHRKLALAIVVALDRSGSMSVPVAGGRTKMDLANLAAAEVLNLLSPMDEFGVLAVDSSAHVISDLEPVTDKEAVRSRVLRIDSLGGGIFVYEALVHAASMLGDATAGTRHIILFADAADSEEPGKYVELLEKCGKAGITVSVIGLGRDSDVDAELLRDIARRGNGRCFFTDKPEELPRLFAQDTFVVARNSFISETTGVRATGGMLALAGRQFRFEHSIGGYNLCYLRPRANLAALTEDEYAAPFVAAWQVGSGRALAYTGEADGEFTGAIAAWPQIGEFFASLARWAAGDSGRLGDDIVLTQEVEKGICVIKLHLDPERAGDPFQELPTVTTLRGHPGRPPQAGRKTMRWLEADTLQVEVALRGRETAINTVELNGVPVSLPPTTLPYSPEYRPVDEAVGSETLRRLSRSTGGKSRDILASIWSDLPKTPQWVELAPWLLSAAMLLFLLEVLERRSGLLSTRPRARRQRVEAAATPAPSRRKRRRRETRPTTASMSDAQRTGEKAAPATPETPATDEKPELLDALRLARKRKRDRS